MRRLNVCAVSLMTAGLAAVTVVSPATAADQKVTVRVVSMPSPTGAAVPNTSYSGLAETNVTVGVDTAGVPCGNCVTGAGDPNIGLPWPIFAVPQGTELTISTWFESTTYTGACTAGLILKQSNTVISSASYPFPGGCAAGYLYGVFFTLEAPTTTGFTTVIGEVAGGGVNKSGASTFINIQ